MGVARKFVELIHARRWVGVAILGAWLAVSVAGACLVGPFLKATVNDLGVPDNAPSRLASLKAAELGLDFSKNLYRLTLFLENATARGTVLSDDAADAALIMIRAVVDRTYPGVTSWDGAVFARQLGQIETAKSFQAPQKQSQLAFVTVDSTVKGVDFMDQFAPFLVGQAEYVGRGVRVSVLGDARNKEVIIGAVSRDLAFGDGIALPVAFVVLAVALRSARLLTLPILNLVLSALPTYGAMYVVAKTIPIISATMSLISSIAIAFSFDYSLFLLSRFVEGGRSSSSKSGDSKGGGARSTVDVVTEMLETAGHNCAVSGSTLLFAFLSLILVPQSTLRGLGVGSFVALLCVILCNLSVTPIMLIFFERFYMASAAPVASCPSWMPGGISKWWMSDSNSEPVEESSFYKLGKRLTTPWVAVVVIFVLSGFCLAFAYPAVTFDQHISDSFLLALPRGDPFSEAVLRLTEDFGKGFLHSYRILVVPPAGTNVYSDPAFIQALKEATDTVLSVGNMTCHNVMSPYVSDCLSISPLLYKACELAPVVSSRCPDLLRLKQASIAPRNDAAVITLSHFSFDAEGTFGLEWYRRLSAALPPTLSGSQIYLEGGEGWDGVVVALSYFPLMVALSFVAIFVFIGVVFRSVMIPIRTVFTIALTLSFVYGAATLVYVYGALSWTHFSGFDAPGAIIWMPPLVSFAMCVGLALDYDVFLLVRIKEEMTRCGDTREAICIGLAKTGSLIGYAGVIMAVAFSSLLFSNSSALNL